MQNRKVKSNPQTRAFGRTQLGRFRAAGTPNAEELRIFNLLLTEDPREILSDLNFIALVLLRTAHQWGDDQLCDRVSTTLEHLTHFTKKSVPVYEQRVFRMLSSL
jgi:hypothetical protein